MFLHEAKQILRSFCCYVFLVLTTLKLFFSRCNFSDNYVLVVSSMHSNVQLLYLLLFFVVVVGGFAVLIALVKVPNVLKDFGTEERCILG